MENIRKFEIVMVIVIFGTLLYAITQRYQAKDQNVKIQDHRIAQEIGFQYTMSQS